MPNVGPNAPPFELYVGDGLVGLLHDPNPEEMFWCSYRIEPASEAGDRILHNESTWAEVRFTVWGRSRVDDGREGVGAAGVHARAAKPSETW